MLNAAQRLTADEHVTAPALCGMLRELSPRLHDACMRWRMHKAALLAEAEEEVRPLLLPPMPLPMRSASPHAQDATIPLTTSHV